MKNHKLELIFAGIFLAIHVVMLAIHQQIKTDTVYWIILDLSLIGCVVLVSRVAWEKFKRTIE